MKKLVVMLLCGILTLSTIAGCGDRQETPSTDVSSEEPSSSETPKDTSEDASKEAGVEKTYDETIPFSMTSYWSIYYSSLEGDITDDYFYQYIMDKFNVEVDLWISDTASDSEKIRLWMNGGSMPNAMNWMDFNYSEYFTYAEQGLIRPLPDDWDTRWPNLKKLVDDSGIRNILEIDGKIYAIPHTKLGIFGNLEKYTEHTSVYLRKDWLDDIGMENLGADGTVTLSEIKEYLEKVKEAGLIENAALGGSVNHINNMFRLANGINTANFFEEDDGTLVWGPTVDGYVEMIKEIQEWYQAGLIDVDYYLNDSSFYRNSWVVETVAAIFAEGDYTNMSRMAATWEESKPGTAMADNLVFASIKAEDGTVYSDGVYNYWMAHVFSPETDDATLERILDIMDYFSSNEGFTSKFLGIIGQDWEYDAEGNIVVLNEDAAPNPYGVFDGWAYLNTDFQFSGLSPDYDPVLIDIMKSGLETKGSGTVLEESDKYNAASGTAIENYSVDINSKITEIVVGGLDVETEWNKFIEDNRALWEPVLEQLNAQ